MADISSILMVVLSMDCAICGHEWNDAYPKGKRPQSLDCPACGYANPIDNDE